MITVADSANTLVIIEAAGKTTAIKRALGKDVHVMACNGNVHAQEATPEDKWCPQAPRFESSQAELIAQIVDMHTDYHKVIIATDNDHAGETIGWHLEQQLTREVPEIASKLYHVRIGNLERGALQSIFNPALDATDNTEFQADLLRVEAELVKNLVDETFVEHIKALSQPIKDSFPMVGRVKAGALGIVNAQSMQRANQVTLNLRVNGKSLKARVNIPQGMKREEWVQQIQQSPSKILDVVSQSRSYSESPNTLNVLRNAAILKGLSPQQTMDAMQALYLGDDPNVST